MLSGWKAEKTVSECKQDGQNWSQPTNGKNAMQEDA